MTASPIRRCAIYTRKSSDEGLDQAFNSLDAQCEAGEAYVKSQASEGWRLLAARYDDGGLSGGSMERPALQRLLADVEAGRIAVLVVYKIDRLTRSLADFARIVEQFDARGVSFVSVTQAFNTTSSMGRLTLNVLLSFAQFEREVTGERIRDKIAASKAKGMWMGGIPPLGYDLPLAGSRTLEVNDAEAEQVRLIFHRYLALGSVHRLAGQLASEGIYSKQRITAAGRPMGGKPFSRGALFHLLRSPVYLGKITHGKLIHQGAHQAIVDADLFGTVQQLLTAQRRRHGKGTERRTGKAPLCGRIFDARGEPMSPTFSRGRSGRLYRYYVSASLQQGKAGPADGAVRRVAAAPLEEMLRGVLARLVPSASEPLAVARQVVIKEGQVEILLPATLQREVGDRLTQGEKLIPQNRKGITVSLPSALPMRGGQRQIIRGAGAPAQPDRALVGALRRAHAMLERDASGMPTIAAAPTSLYARRTLSLAFLAPDIQRDILAGMQPAQINLEALMQLEIPFDWNHQRRILGWDL